MPLGIRNATTFMENNLAVHNTEISLPFNQYLGIHPAKVKAPFLKSICTRMSMLVMGEKKSETTWMSETHVNGILCSWKKELDIYLMT